MHHHLPLAEVSGGCTKPNCGHRAALNRHHKAHEALWLGAWAHRGLEPKWRAFVKRYYEFRPEDTVRVCLPHHAEIHSIYDEIIADDMAKTGLPLYLYSWKQGRILMQRLTNACEAWLFQETPGIDSVVYEQTKRVRRKLLKQRARRRHPPQDRQKTLASTRSKKLRKGKKRHRHDA